MISFIWNLQRKYVDLIELRLVPTGDWERREADVVGEMSEHSPGVQGPDPQVLKTKGQEAGIRSSHT